MKHPTLLVVLLVAVRLTAAPEVALEKLPLTDPADRRTWSPAECTAEASNVRVKEGASSWRWHIDVDYFAGEAKYPIGWPRIAHTFPAGEQRDWSAWDFLHCWIYVETSREALPKEPAGLGLHVPDRANNFNRPLAELKKNEWIELNLPVRDIPRHGDVRQIQFHIAESNYRHGDQLDFYLNDLSLTRYVEPTLFEVTPENAVLFADATRLAVRFRLLGIKPDTPTEVTCELLREGQSVAQVKLAATRGEQRAVLDFGGRTLAVGHHSVRARVGGRVFTATTAVRVVESPWSTP